MLLCVWWCWSGRYRRWATRVNGDMLVLCVLPSQGVILIALAFKIAGSDPVVMKFDEGGSKAKAWKDIWGSGQGIGAVSEVVPAADLVARLTREYQEARAALCSGAATG